MHSKSVSDTRIVDEPTGLVFSVLQNVDNTIDVDAVNSIGVVVSNPGMDDVDYTAVDPFENVGDAIPVNTGESGNNGAILDLDNANNTVDSISVAVDSVSSLNLAILDPGSGIIGVDGRKKKRNTSQKSKRKELRESGMEYTTKKGKVVPAKSLKAACTDKCLRKCSSHFTPEDRAKLFDEFWKTSKLQQKEFILKFVKKETTTRLTVAHPSRRQFSRMYFLPKEDETIQVCQRFFLATLDITPKFLRYTENCSSSVLHTAKKDMRGRQTPKNRTPPRSLQHLREFIESLPAVEPHYTRNSGGKKYLPESAENLSKIYRVYKEYCTSKKFKPVSDFVFRKVFSTEYNIGIHVPKKDKCAECLKNKSLINPTLEEDAVKKAHDDEKNAINKIYSECQQRSRVDHTFLTTSFDLEKVLTTPHGKSVLFFYARKYAVYNLTFYESFTRNVFCYIWGETDAQRGCVEVCSIMEKYLRKIDSRGEITELALFCDNCAGQQKNMAMIALMIHFIKTSTNIKKISLNFLMVGHSLMTVDSVHGCIERAVKNKIVYAPSEWPTIISNARFDPHPYTVIKLSYTDFRDWKTVGNKTNVTLSSKEKLKVSEIRMAIFEKSLMKKNNFKVIFNARNPEEVVATVKRKRNLEFIEPSPQYCNPLPISAKK